ncbi:hypothetical protein C0J52_08562 [Blattella germanica]|nr:hypothetical protein C0J52_08562 [Blattella germanica]
MSWTTLVHALTTKNSVFTSVDMETLRIVVAIATLWAAGVDSRKKGTASDFFTPICHRSDPDISGCFQKVIENLNPSLVKGIPELKLTPMEPLVIPRMEFHEGNGNFHINQVMTNLTIHGLSTAVVKNVT